MIGDDGLERFEILLDKAKRNFLGWLVFKNGLKNRNDAIKFCVNMAERWFHKNGDYPGFRETGSSDAEP